MSTRFMRETHSNSNGVMRYTTHHEGGWRNIGIR